MKTEAEIIALLAARDVIAMAWAPYILPRGYIILDTRPGAINYWRKLGDKSRPLAPLAAFEAGL